MKNLLIILLMLPVLGWGHCYYVSTTGNDTTGNGSITTPYRSIKFAYDQTSAGDTVYIRGGLYKPNVQQVLTGKNGTAGNLIKIWAYPGETPILSKGAGYTEVIGVVFSGNYIHFKGLVITGFKQIDENLSYGMYCTLSNNCIFENLSIHDNGCGMTLRSNTSEPGICSGNLIKNCDFYNNQDSLTQTGTGSGPYGDADGLSVCYITSACTNYVIGCRFWWNSDDGIDLWDNQGVLIMTNCWSFWNGFKPGTFTDANSIYSSGNGFKMGGSTVSRTGVNIRIVANCVASYNKWHGFNDNNSVCGMTFYNNTSVSNGYTIFNSQYGNGFNFNYTGNPNIAKNNIAFNNKNYDAAFSVASTVDSNTFNGGAVYTFHRQPFASDFVSLDSTQLTRPRVNGSLPEITFMHLVDGSDLIDSGIAVGLPYVGTAPDLGAFEYGRGFAKSAGKMVKSVGKFIKR